MQGGINEDGRLGVLRRLNILDTPPEEVFDRIVSMAADYFDAPVAIVSFLDETRQWFKAVYGLDVRETARDISFCQYTVQDKRVTVVTDAQADERFRDNPLVTTAPDLRFYAAAPILTSDNQCLGTVAVLDRKPRPPLSPKEERFLENLACTVAHELGARLAAAEAQAEAEERRRLEQRLQLAVAHTPITLASLDPDLRYTWVVNPPPPMQVEDFVGRTDLDLWPGDLGEHLMTLKREILASGASRRVDITIPVSGIDHEFDATIEPLMDGGKVSGLSYAAVDVTERKRAERALAVAEARHRAVLDTAVDAIIVSDDQGIVVHFNQSAERVFGYTAEEVIGQNMRMLMPEPDRGLHDEYIRRYIRTGKARIIGIGREVEGLRKDGSLVPLDLQVGEWRENGLRMFTGTMRDITKRRERERALQRAEDARAETLTLLNTIVESIPDALFSKDRHGRYMVANAVTARILGANPVGKLDIDMMPASTAAIMRAHDKQILDGGEPTVVETELYDHQRGEMRWFLTVKTALRRPDGDIIGVVGLGRDVTDQRRMVQALQDARDEAERANRSKSTFLAAASHDLRQPVQALALFTSALESKLAGHPAAEVMVRMRKSVEALQGLLEGLLDISRLDAGVIEVHKRHMRLADAIGDLVTEYAARASAKGLKFHAVSCRYWTETDPVLLERVVRNLLDNALKYTEHGSILVGCRRRGHVVRLQIIDTGIGINKENIENIFQEFVQLDNPSRDRAKGLGLGLSIVRRLLSLLEHHMEVDSTLGRGTRFSIDLPRLPPQGEQLAGPAGTVETALAHKQVLVIEDEEMVRQGMEMLVSGWGCRVIPASNEEEAVAVSSQRPPDMIIADYRLQGGRLGTDAVKAVQQACGRAIPAMIVTGDTAPERIKEVKASGFALAHKPVPPDRLRSFIDLGK